MGEYRMEKLVLILGLFIIIAAFSADQLSKIAADMYVADSHGLAIFDWFNLIKVWNTGVSFSMFNDYGNIGKYLLIILALIVCAFLLYLMLKEKNKLKITALGLIIGGALGNVIDRIRFGAVFDFLDFHYQTYHWPAFNLADTFICIGAGLLIMMEVLNSKKKGIN